MQKSKAEKYLVTSVKDAMRILRLYTKDCPELGVTEISRKIGRSKSTTHRLISMLTDKGYLQKNPDTNKYCLGLSVLRLSGVMITHKMILRESERLLNKLTDELGEATHLGVLEGAYIAYLYKADPKQPASLRSDIGKRNPTFCTGVGKAILAFLPPKMVDQIIEESLIVYGRHSFDPDQLKRQLAVIRDNGYTVCTDELHEGVTSIGAPVFDYSETVVAGLSVAGPTQRIKANLPGMIDSVTETANKISAELGFFKS